MLIKVKPNYLSSHNDSTFKLKFAAGKTVSAPADLLSLTSWSGLLSAEKTVDQATPGEWTMNAWLENGNAKASCLDPDAIEDIVLIYMCRVKDTRSNVT